MLLRVLVDIYNKTHEIGFAVDRDSFEGAFKQCACSLYSDIDAARIGVEEVGEILAGFFEFETPQVFSVLYAPRNMKVISQKTICPRVCNWTNILPPQFHKIGIVSFLNKDVFAVVATIVDVIKSSVSDGWDIGGHR